jgi:spore germination cell wall hydrolase CwlJ-like protein
MSLRAGFSMAAVVCVGLLAATAAASPNVDGTSHVTATPNAMVAGPELAPPALPTASSADRTPSEAETVSTPSSLDDRDEPLDVRVANAGADVAQLDSELECMAKVVHHEAANQSLQGQLAVAQLILNRVKSPLFPKTICKVVNQRGQFFSTKAYAAPVSSPRWRTSVAIARIARIDDLPAVAPGALFYHASYVTPSWSHRRVKVARIGANVFYR